MSKELETNLLKRLIDAEKSGKPLTMADLGAEARGSTFEDLWQTMDIVIKGQENVLCCQAFPDSKIIASTKGRWKYEAHEAKRLGKPVPPSPPSKLVYLF